MKVYSFINLLIFITSSFCQDETVLQCSPKPGCQIVQCDPTPPRWDQFGLSIEKHLTRNEFPITCKTPKATQSQNNGNLLSLITGTIQYIRRVNSDLNEVEIKVDENADKIKEIVGSDKTTKLEFTGITENREKIEEQSLEISELREMINQHSSKLSEIHKPNSDQKSEIDELRKTNKQQSNEISALRKENDKRSSEISELKKENSEEQYNIPVRYELVATPQVVTRRAKKHGPQRSFPDTVGF
ncbi:uncharacterized protein LOC144425236 [Styela clava]